MIDFGWYNALVILPVWLAVSLWFGGMMLRTAGRTMPFLTCWLAGAILMVVHIIASYGVVHGWSHAAAIEATRLESFKVTGINAGWGVYVNFAFAVSWLGYSIFGLMGKRLRLSLEVALLTFQILIIFSATIVFETGLIRWLAVIAFLGVTIQWLYVRSNSIQKRSSDG